MPQEIDLNKLSLIELKALYYDLATQKSDLEHKLNVILSFINKPKDEEK